jgi:hypothetical protein
MKTLTGLILASGALVLWYQRQRARDQARVAVERACRETEVILLDQAVELNGWRWVGEPGRRRLLRVVGFEFTTGADDRHRGEVLMERGRIAWVGLTFPEGVQWWQPGAGSDPPRMKGH